MHGVNLTQDISNKNMNVDIVFGTFKILSSLSIDGRIQVSVTKISGAVVWLAKMVNINQDKKEFGCEGFLLRYSSIDSGS